MSTKTVHAVVGRVDISDRKGEPMRLPATWDEDVKDAVEAGRITHRRAERIMTERGRG